MRLLLVEDDPQRSKTLARRLRERAHAVDTASDGVQAVDLALVNRHEAIVLDVGLPARDGFEVAQELRARRVQTDTLSVRRAKRSDHRSSFAGRSNASCPSS